MSIFYYYKFLCSELFDLTVKSVINLPIDIFNFKCFGSSGSGAFSLANITVLIGRNNSGKSSIADALRWLAHPKKSYDKARHGRAGADTYVEIPYSLKETDLVATFQQNVSGGEIGINHWQYGRRYVGAKVLVRHGHDLTPLSVSGLDFPELPQTASHHQQRIIQQLSFPWKDIFITDVSAERDVRPEEASQSVALDANGNGLTNMVRAFINRDNLPRHEVEIELLRELNLVFLGDANFLRISCRENDVGQWEIFLTEETKGDVRLSQSGSSLKSIFIILAKLRLEPIIKAAQFENCIVVVEEPENNLHPALLRRLLEFLAAKSDELGFGLVIATHSPIAIDWLSRRDEGKVLHVTTDGTNSKVREVSGYLDVKQILDDLDIRASDLLQSNGVIWVEGPSDRIYVRRWLELISGGTLKEGVHYSIMFYGGKLLSHLTALPPDEKETLVNTLSINRNVALLMDSDRHLGGDKTARGRTRKPRLGINDTKKRIKDEIASVKGFVWVTEGREIENYMPDAVLQAISGNPTGSVGLYDKIPESPVLKGFSGDKLMIASAASSIWRVEHIEASADLSANMKALANVVRRWNAIDQL